MQHILIADDSRSLREAIKRRLVSVGYQVSCANDGIEAYDLVCQLNPDLVILDEQMPRLGGSQLIQILRSEGNTIPIVMLTARLAGEERHGDEREITCLKAGCDDFLYKPFKPDLFLARVKALLRRSKAVFQQDASNELLSYADVRVDLSEHAAYRGSRRLQLTIREYTLLTLFLRHPKQVLERGLIVDHVWGYDYEGTSNVVDVYVRYVRRALEAHDEVRLIQTVRGVGYVLREPVEGDAVSLAPELHTEHEDR